MNDRQQNNDVDGGAGHTAQPFSAIGLSAVGYARPAELDGRQIFAIHAADGAQIGAAPTREHAHAAMIQNGLIPLSLH